MDVEKLKLEPRTVIGLHETVPMAALTDFYGRAYEAVGSELLRLDVASQGPPMAIYHGAPTDTVDVFAGFPIGEPVEPAAPVSVVTLPGGPAVATIHTGTYDSMVDTYGALTAWMSEHGLTPGTDMWEEYLVGPDGERDSAAWKTRIVWPLAA